MVHTQPEGVPLNSLNEVVDAPLRPDARSAQAPHLVDLEDEFAAVLAERRLGLAV